MNILQISAVCVCISVLALSVKKMNAEAGQLITVAATTIVIVAVIPYITAIVSAMYDFAELSPSAARFLTPVLKITGIAYISTIGSELCADSGEKALASRVESAGKIAVTVLAIPIAREAFAKIMGILT